MLFLSFFSFASSHRPPFFTGRLFFKVEAELERHFPGAGGWCCKSPFFSRERRPLLASEHRMADACCFASWQVTSWPRRECRLHTSESSNFLPFLHPLRGAQTLLSFYFQDFQNFHSMTEAIVVFRKHLSFIGGGCSLYHFPKKSCLMTDLNTFVRKRGNEAHF